MKNVCIIFLLSIIISLTAVGFSGRNSAQSDLSSQYLRIHIRAHSDDEEQQAVKYLVRDEIVQYLTPVVAHCQTQSQAVQSVRDCLVQIERTAEWTLRENGFFYGATVSVRQEYFPTRVYDGCTLPSGEYTALIVELGEGKGQNWWCVVYPPLCFASPSGQNVIYKSKILEIIRRWKNA